MIRGASVRCRRVRLRLAFLHSWPAAIDCRAADARGLGGLVAGLAFFSLWQICHKLRFSTSGASLLPFFRPPVKNLPDTTSNHRRLARSQMTTVEVLG